MSTEPTTDRPAIGPQRFQQTAPSTQRGPDRVAALGSALLLLLLVVGVPAALVWLEAVPAIPRSLPTRDQLTGTIGVEQLLAVLVWVVWIAWLQFTLCVVVEVRSAARGVGLPARVPLAGPSQRLARTLVASVLLLTTAAGPATALTQAPVVPEAAPVAASQSVDGVVPTSGTGATQEAQRTDAVARGDVTYRLGAMVLDQDEGASLVGRKVYVVQPPDGRYHDNLWDIAERELGDGRRYREIFELNKDREQPDGRELSLARLIHPNWLLIMPEDAAGAERVVAVTEQAPPAETPPPVDVAPPGSTVQEADVPVADGSTASTLAEHQGLVGAGLLAAGLLAAMEATRRRRRTPEPSTEAAEVEIALRIGAGSARAAHLEQALRGLAAAMEVARRPLPPVYAARVDDAAVELLLAPAVTDAPEPWQAVDDGRRWVRAHGAEDAVTRRRGAAPYPGLVSVGRDESGADVLLDLEAAQGPVSVVGDPAVARQVVVALAAELATNAWSGPVVVHGVDLPPALTALGERYRATDDPRGVVREWGAAAGSDVLTGRSLAGSGTAWAGDYLVLGGAPDADLGDELARATGGGRGPWGVVCAGEVPGARWRLEVDADGALRSTALGLAVTANRLLAREVEAVAELLAPPPTDEPSAATPLGEQVDRPDVPLVARPVLPADLEHAAVAVRVLGTPDVRAPGVVDAERLALVTELVVHVALHPDGVHPAVLAGDLWPHGVTAEVRDATLDRARAWLGTDAAGQPRLRTRPDGRLVLAPDVVLDWHVLATLLRRSRSAPDLAHEREDLRAALRLARGAVLAHRPEGRYAWLVRARLERLSRDLVVDAAHRLAAIDLDGGDPGGAAQAARAGLAVVPVAEVLWRDVVRAAAAGGGADAVREVAAELEETLHRSGAGPMSSPTAALLEELAPGSVVPERTGA